MSLESVVLLTLESVVLLALESVVLLTLESVVLLALESAVLLALVSVVLLALESAVLLALVSVVIELCVLSTVEDSVLCEFVSVPPMLVSFDCSLDEGADSLCVDSVEPSSEQEQSNAKRRRVSIKSFFICQNQRITSNIALSSPSVSTPLRDLTS